MRISDWSSDVCSSDLLPTPRPTLFINTRIQPVAPYHADARRNHAAITPREARRTDRLALLRQRQDRGDARRLARGQLCRAMLEISLRARLDAIGADTRLGDVEIDLHDPPFAPDRLDQEGEPHRSEEHTSELQSLLRISYAVF